MSRLHGIVLAAFLLAGCRSEIGFTPADPVEDLAHDHGQWLSMDRAPDDDLVVAYYDRTSGALGFSIGDEQADGSIAWEHEEVDGYANQSTQGLDPGDRGKYCSMKVGPDGHVWVSYQNTTNGALMVAHRIGKSWTNEVVDTGSGATPNTGLFTSLAIDADGRPVVAYHDAAKGHLAVAHYDGSAWTTEIAWAGTPWEGTDAEGNPVTRKAAAGMFAKIVIVGNTEYIAFYDGAHKNLHLVEGFPGAYVHSVIAQPEPDAVTGDVGAWPSLWSDGTDTLVAYHDVGNQDLKLARRSSGSTWQISTVDDGEYVGADSEIFYKDGAVAIVYFNGHDNDMMLARETGSSWTTEKLGGDGGALGFFNEVVQKKDGTWWAASYDYTNRRIHTLTLPE